jgi:NhaA family Na+:H+ antiporter
MARQKVGLTEAFKDFLANERAGAIVLIICTVVSLAIANSNYGVGYLDFWQGYIGPLSVEHWVNDGLMAIFFLLIGLELERELYAGELSSFKRALLPIFGALGGILVPAAIHFAFNAGTPTQAGTGIPMATDIAFAIGVLALLGPRVPASLKVFLVALAVMDDLGAIYLFASLGVVAVLFLVNRLGVMSLIPYLAGGAFAWFFMLKSGVHATIAGVLVAFTIPFTRNRDDRDAPSQKLQHLLHTPVSFLILPIFALANTGIVIGGNWSAELTSPNSLGIILGLVTGKPLGITLAAFAAVSLGICRLPLDLNWKHVLGAGMLGGIGFTMSIFITNLAFPGNSEVVNASKMAILAASLAAGTAGFVYLKLLGQPNADDEDMESMDFEEDDESDRVASA